MTFQKKITIIFFVFVIGLPFGSWWYNKRTHPVIVPLPPRKENTITIIPGWNLRNVAEYLVSKNIASTTAQVFAITGVPARDYRTVASVFPGVGEEGKIFTDRPKYQSYEGYIAPETYRVFADASLPEVLKKLFNQRAEQVTPEIYANVVASGHSFHEILTMASIIEEESKTDSDRKIISDILWRRVKNGWPLQVDSSVHYAVNKTGDVFTTTIDRKVESPWNTYKYAGLPLGPICNPSMESIEAALVPEKNSYWYFLSGSDGVMHYAKNLDEHNRNRVKYL
jgi:UPF0755 protein